MNQKIDKSEVQVIKGEFSTDGNTFVFQLAGTPFSGIGNSPTAAFEDLVRVQAASGTLAQRLRELARDQQGEMVRAAIVRTSIIGLVVLAVVAGALVGTAAMLPRVAADLTEVTTRKLGTWLDTMPPSTEQRLTALIQRLSAVTRGSDANCPSPPQSPQ